MKAVIDEDLHRSLATILAKLGFEVLDIREHGLRGQPDDKIFHFAQKQKAVLFSGDVGFADIIRYPLGKHFGICVLRFPNEMPTSKINSEVEKQLKKLSFLDYTGNLIILSPSRIRIRRAKS